MEGYYEGIHTIHPRGHGTHSNSSKRWIQTCGSIEIFSFLQVECKGFVDSLICASAVCSLMAAVIADPINDDTNSASSAQ